MNETEQHDEHDDYLWDRTGTPDPLVARLERTMGTLRYRGAAPATETRRLPSAWRRAAPLAAAALVALAALATWKLWPAPPPPPPGAATTGWEARALAGTVRIDDTAAGGQARLGLDQWLETSAEDQVVLDVADIGTVTVYPDSRLRLAESKAGVEHRLELARGRIEAFIAAPPRLFFVDTPAARAVDLGCAYELAVDETGRGELIVTLGMVSFERDRLISTVPAEGVCMVRPGVGPGTPFFGDATPAFRGALESFDFEGGGAAALATVLSDARTRDALSLWHLLGRAAGAEREAVYDRLALLSPPPPAVDRAAALRGDASALQAWWDDLERDWPFTGVPPSDR